MENRKIFFVSLGCPKNLVDSEIMLGVLKSRGYGVTDDPSEASIAVINTCGFIREAKDESIGTILEYARLKKNGLEMLVVTGCMVQRYKEEFAKSLPEVDIFIGTNDYAKIADYIDEFESSGAVPGSVLMHADEPSYVHTSATPRMLSTSGGSAYLKIAEGCRNHCSYCIIPHLRGGFRSRREDDIIDEARNLAKNGVIEINLIAQDTAAYGCDLGGGENLASLLRKLCGIEGIKWLRILYLHPGNIDREVLEIIRSEEKIVKYIDLPVQHISSRILKLMNRHQTEKQVRDVIDAIRAKLPEASLRTSLIVGFPSETKEDFNMLCDFVKEVRFDNLGVFRYSREEGTKASGMAGQIHHSTKMARYKKLLDIQADIARENNQKYLNTTLPVLIEGKSEESEYLIKGRTAFQAPDIDGCVYITEGEYKTGTIQNVGIYETHTYDLFGRINVK